MTSVRAQLHSSGPQQEMNEITTVALWGSKSVRISRVKDTWSVKEIGNHLKQHV